MDQPAQVITETVPPPVPVSPQPPVLPKKTSKLPLILLVILTIGIVGVSAFWLGKSSSKPKIVAQPTPTVVSTISEPTPTPDPTAGWKTYANTKYGYQLSFPSEWDYLEVPTQKYQVGKEQVWLSNTGWPPPQTGARAPIVINYSKENPEINYRQELFDSYKKENITVGNSFSGVMISGFSKEGQFNETIVIMPFKTSDFSFISFLPVYGRGENVNFDKTFDQILFTFKFLP